MSAHSVSARGSAGLPVAANPAPAGELRVSLRHCELADREHEASPRQYAHTFHYAHTICLADAFWRLPKANRDGIILHEMGHLLAGIDASEAAADAAVESRTGSRIHYVDSRYGRSLESSPSPSVAPELRFDRVAGRGSAGLPVAVPNPTYTGRKMTQAERDAAYAEEDAQREAAEKHAEWVRQQQEKMLSRRPNVTDRALRYRANEVPPEGPRVCCYCGSTRYVEIDHVNGFEDDTSRENLVWSCRRCNTLKGVVFRNAGRGRRTAQYNPTRSGGAATVGEWIRAVGSIIPHKGAQYAGANYGLAEAMPVGDAVAMIRATPQYKRSEYASQLRKHRGGRRRAEEVPF